MEHEAPPTTEGKAAMTQHQAKLTDKGREALKAIIRNEILTGRTYIAKGAQYLKLQRDGYILKAADGWWTPTADTMNSALATSVDLEIRAEQSGKSVRAVILDEMADDHQVTIETAVMSNGDTVYYGTCEHDWTTGFYAEPNDARDVARGHGEVTRPLYVFPVEDKDVCDKHSGYNIKGQAVCVGCEDAGRRVIENAIGGPLSDYQANALYRLLLGTGGSFMIDDRREVVRSFNIRQGWHIQIDTLRVMSDRVWATPAKSDALMDRIRALPGGDAPVSAADRPRFNKHKSTSRARRFRKGA